MCQCEHSIWRVMEELDRIRKGIKEIMSVITVFADKVNANFVALGASLDNISTDEANLSKQITDLKNQIAAGGSTLTPEDQAALDLVDSNSTAMASRTATIASNVPDLPVLPPGV